MMEHLRFFSSTGRLMSSIRTYMPTRSLGAKVPTLPYLPGILCAEVRMPKDSMLHAETENHNSPMLICYANVR